MRKLFLGVALAAPLLLAGCAGGGLTFLPSNVIKDVQAEAGRLCAFVPTEATIQAIFAAIGVGGSFADYASVAARVCATVSTFSSARGRRFTPPVVVINGKRIVIRGQRVSGRSG